MITLAPQKKTTEKLHVTAPKKSEVTQFISQAWLSRPLPVYFISQRLLPSVWHFFQTIFSPACDPIAQVTKI